jgi:AcrR family transcriptional regulator
MPKKAYSDDEVRAQKERIMDEASQVLAVAGVNNLSMRALAASTGMTAANLYNYFPSKQQLFVETTERGFALLDSYTRQGLDGATDPRQKLVSLLKSALRFSRDWTGYWELMLHPPISLRENLDEGYAAMDGKLRQRTVERMMVVFAEILGQYGITMTPPADDQSLPGISGPGVEEFGADAVWVRVITLLTNTHGLIDLYNHRMLEKLDVDVEALVDALLIASIEIILPEAGAIGAGTAGGADAAHKNNKGHI